MYGWHALLCMQLVHWGPLETGGAIIISQVDIAASLALIAMMMMHTIGTLNYGVTTVVLRPWMMISLWKHDICPEWLPSMKIRRMTCLLDVESSHWMRYGADGSSGAGEKRKIRWVIIKPKAELTLIEDLLQRETWMMRRMTKNLQNRMCYIRIHGEREKICVEHQWR